jgi:hypothetical protein
VLYVPFTGLIPCGLVVAWPLASRSRAVAAFVRVNGAVSPTGTP